MNTKTMLNSYYTWLNDQTSTKELDTNWVEVTVPFLDRHNDYIQCYLRFDGQYIHLSDDGDTLADLLLNGYDLSIPTQQETLTVILNGFNIQHDDEVLQTTTTYEEFPVTFHNFIQAILAINLLAQTRLDTLYGAFAGKGTAPSEEDIRMVRREVWGELYQ